MAEISPSARVDDGSMDLWLFSGDTLLETFQHMFDLASGKHADSEKTQIIHCREVRIQSKAELYLQLDGEPISQAKQVTINISPKSLRVLVPRDLPRPLFSKNP